MGAGTLPVRQRSTSSAGQAASASASVMPVSPSCSGPTGTRTPVETHEANLGGLGYVGDLSEPAELIGSPRGLGDHGRRPGRGRAALPAVLASRPFDDPQPRRLGEPQCRGSARGALAGIHGRRRGTCRPRAVLVENVPDLPSWDDGSVLMGFYESLEDLGYTVDARVLDALPVRRAAAPGPPVPRRPAGRTHVRVARALGRTITTLRDAIGDLPPVPPAQRAERIPYYGVPRSPFQRSDA